MKNRESLYPGRVKLTTVDEANGIYDMERADQPVEEGTPLNKRLLDFAVAACGVTSGTSTAFTLDDEFGGFELVDGAKVNFRLHVASGANPTLNVNGTGAKAIKTMRGIAMGAGVAKGAWVSARYSAENDCYIVPSADVTIAQYTIEEEHTEFRMSIPGGYSVYRLRAAFWKSANAGSALTTLYLTSDISLRITSGGAYGDSFIGTDQSGTSAFTDVPMGDKGGFADLMIVIDGTTKIVGTLGTSGGIAGIGAIATGEISYLGISIASNYPLAGTFVTLEGIS